MNCSKYRAAFVKIIKLRCPKHSKGTKGDPEHPGDDLHHIPLAAFSVKHLVKINHHLQRADSHSESTETATLKTMKTLKYLPEG